MLPFRKKENSFLDLASSWFLSICMNDLFPPPCDLRTTWFVYRLKEMEIY